MACNGNGIAHFYDPHGFVRYDARRPEVRLPNDDPVAGMMRENGSSGRGEADSIGSRCGWTEPGPWTASVRWEREADIPAPVLFRAIEAVLPERAEISQPAWVAERAEMSK
ncbi:MAG: hypothetical protein WEG36_15180 [Gemmatimonadota bacterium]